MYPLTCDVATAHARVPGRARAVQHRLPARLQTAPSFP
jgi:hypothetical protein